jgi:hypothetical protein
MILIKASAVGLVTATLVGTVTVGLALRSISRTIRSPDLAPELEKRGYFMIEPALNVDFNSVLRWIRVSALVAGPWFGKDIITFACEVQNHGIKTNAVVDVRADEPERAMEQFTDGLRRVLAAPKPKPKRRCVTRHKY